MTLLHSSERAYTSRCVYAQEYLIFFIIKFKSRKVNFKFDFARSQLFGAKQQPIVKIEYISNQFLPRAYIWWNKSKKLSDII